MWSMIKNSDFRSSFIDDLKKRALHVLEVIKGDQGFDLPELSIKNFDDMIKHKRPLNPKVLTFIVNQFLASSKDII
jgi:hypothetical protein